MTTAIKAIFFDIGGTLVEKTKYPERDIEAFAEMATLLNLDCPADELLDRINKGQQAYKAWCERTLNELTIEEKWAKFLLPDVDQSLVRKLAPQLQQARTDGEQ